MFFVRFLFFSLAMLFSHLQADELGKRSSFDGDNHTIQIHVTATPKKNISCLASLKLADKEKKSTIDISTNPDISNLNTDSHCHDDLVNDTKRTSYKFIINSPHLDQLKKIAKKFKEKIHRSKNSIAHDEYEPILLGFGVDDYVEKEASNVDDGLAIQVHASEVKMGGSYIRSTPTPRSASTARATKVDTRFNPDPKIKVHHNWSHKTSSSTRNPMSDMGAELICGIGWAIYTVGNYIYEDFKKYEQAEQEKSTLAQAAEKLKVEKVVRDKLLQEAAEQERLKKIEAEKLKLASQAADKAEREAKTLRDIIEQAKCQKPETILGEEEDCPVVCMPKNSDNVFLDAIINSNQVFDEKSNYKIYDDEFNKKYSHLGVDQSVITIGTTIILGGGSVAGSPIVGAITGTIYAGIVITKLIQEYKQNSGGGGGDNDKDKKKKEKEDKERAEKAAKAKAVLDKENQIKLERQQIEDRLPSGFRGTRDKNGEYPKDKHGNCVDNNGHAWHWNEKTNKFDIFTKHGRLAASMSPAVVNASATPVIAEPLKTTVPVPQLSPVLDHPMPPREEPKQGGCGGDKPETPTSTAHTSNPELDKVDKQPQGCGKPTKTPAELADEMTLHAKKAEIKLPVVVEPVKGSKEYTEKYPYGKAHPSGKHHENSPDGIGKPTRDAQDALNKSFSVGESKERIAVQDGNVIILKKTGDGLYHGYIDNNIKSLDQDVKNALIENGYLKDGKSKKLIKK